MRNREKAVIVDALKNKHSLPVLLKWLALQGEISPSVTKKIERDFHADKQNQKWLTDITEFAFPAGKVYLSALVDCFDGMLPGWTIGTTPDSALVNAMLDQVIVYLPVGERPIIHSDLEKCKFFCR